MWHESRTHFLWIEDRTTGYDKITEDKSEGFKQFLDIQLKASRCDVTVSTVHHGISTPGAAQEGRLLTHMLTVFYGHMSHPLKPVCSTWMGYCKVDIGTCFFLKGNISIHTTYNKWNRIGKLFKTVEVLRFSLSSKCKKEDPGWKLNWTWQEMIQREDVESYFLKSCGYTLH